MQNFNGKVLSIVRKIRKGEFRTYKEVAGLASNSKAARAVGNILAKNRNLKIPCHRVIKSNGLVGGYLGTTNLSWKKIALLLKEGVVVVMPTDTIYGICGSAFNKKTVGEIYRLRKRNFKKPMIVLISGMDELKKFKIILGLKDRKVLEKIWPAKISVVLECKNRRFKYLHRGTKTLAFRVPKNELLTRILKISGPLVAPSANREGNMPARTISEAKIYFKDKVVYYNGGKIIGRPSMLIKFLNGKLETIRK
jgi:L-threonylcarbamoyladenylate synthase